MSTVPRPHSCRYCKRIAIVRDRIGNHLQVDLSYQQVLRASSLGCRLLHGRIRKLWSSRYRGEYQNLRLRGYVMPDDEDSGFLWFTWTGFQSIDYREEGEDELQVFALKGNPAGRYIRNRPLNAHPASAQTFAWMKRCLDYCREHHEKCRRIWESRRLLDMPLRLLEVGTVDTPVAYLRVTKPEEMENYAIPSYAWGTGAEAHAIDAIKTNRANLHERLEKGMRLSTLPRTLQDLIIVTQQLGLRYLWIDALCIVQDDPDESRRELGRMGEIYQRSEILLSAAMAKHSGQGFLQARNLNQAYGAVYELPYRLNIDGEERGSVLLCEGSLFNVEEPVHTRIWTYQEHILALRTLGFGSKQIQWECVENHATDGGSLSMGNSPPFVRRGKLKASFAVSDLEDYERDGMFIDWVTEVEEYSTRNFSRQSDRLPAFAVATRLFSYAAGLPVSECCNGLWKSDAHRQLLWAKPVPENREERCAPSWSWATLPGPVIYPCTLDWQDCTLKNTIFTGSRLDVKGFFRKAHWNGRSVKELCKQKPFMFSRGILPLKIMWGVELSAQPVWLLEVTSKYQISKSRGLVLVRDARGDGAFKRCGYFELDHLRLDNLDLDPVVRRRLLELLDMPNWIQQGDYGYISIT
ncbi:hypothetical protein RB594_008449 [Gaeumannomyces avenae]